MKIEFKFGVRQDGQCMTDAYEIDEVFSVEIDEDTFPISKADMLHEAAVDANDEETEETDEAIMELMQVSITGDLLKEMYQRLYHKVTDYVEENNLDWFELTITKLSINGKAILPNLPYNVEEEVFYFSCVYGEYDPDGTACWSY